MLELQIAVAEDQIDVIMGLFGLAKLVQVTVVQDEGVFFDGLFLFDDGDDSATVPPILCVQKDFSAFWYK